MNKKLLALLLAILMVAVSACAMADTSSVAVVKTIDKDAPTETFTFESELVSVPNGITLDNYKATLNLTSATAEVTAGSAGTGDTTITGSGTFGIPAASSYPAVGIYKYRVKEVEPAQKTSGVSYNTTTQYEVWVTIYNGTNGYERAASIHTVGDDGTATDTKATEVAIRNTYAANSLTVTKTVSGSSADLRDTFQITVTFTDPDDGTKLKSNITAIATESDSTTPDANKVSVTKNFDGYTFVINNVNNNDYVTFSNIPAGVKYTVVETNDVGSISGKRYTSSVTGYTGDNGVIETTNAVTVANSLNEQLDTGVNTDNTPYILLMALVAIMALAFVAKKRSVRE